MHYMLTIDRIENDKVILRDEFDNTIILPHSKIPASAREGSVLHLTLQGNDSGDSARAEAKDILNEILNDEDQL